MAKWKFVTKNEGRQQTTFGQQLCNRCHKLGLATGLPKINQLFLRYGNKRLQYSAAKSEDANQVTIEARLLSAQIAVKFSLIVVRNYEVGDIMQPK